MDVNIWSFQGVRGSLLPCAKPTGSAYVPTRAAGGEDARALVPEHTDGPLGARDSIRRGGPTRRWLKVQQGILGLHVINTSA